VAMLSGSGPSVYAVYDTESEAMRARESLSPSRAFTWIGRPIRTGAVLIKE
jgi:4-diphosphocytidyl-2C-methyl-D-erythritol kinase